MRQLPLFNTFSYHYTNPEGFVSVVTNDMTGIGDNILDNAEATTTGENNTVLQTVGNVATGGNATTNNNATTTAATVTTPTTSNIVALPDTVTSFYEEYKMELTIGAIALAVIAIIRG